MDNASPPADTGNLVATTHTSQLRTLLVCDLVDSTPLVERLGDRKAANLIQRHDQIARDLIERHQGLEIDKTDGFLILFERPSQAVAFALDYHRALQQLSTELGIALWARVGIHVGDVVVWGNTAQAIARGAKLVEVEGVAKPTTARLAQLAMPGQILLSGVAAAIARRAEDEIDAAPGALRWVRHGRYRLKGLPEPIEVVEAGIADQAPLRAPANGRGGSRAGVKPGIIAAAIGVAVLLGVAAGAWQWFARTAQAPPAPKDSIAVLPFVNLDGDPGQAYFSNGITEELTDALGKNAGLTVIAWDTASHFADSKLSPAEIGRTLDVAYLLGGSVQHAGGEVRVSTELVSAATGRQLWSAHYDGSLQNIFAVQDRISSSIADVLKLRFAGASTAPTRSPQAHEFYLHGITAMQRGSTAKALQSAQDDFLQALKLDPNYADAWAGVAETYLQLAETTSLPIKQALVKVRQAAGKALVLDPRNVLALVTLGNADINDNRIAEAKAEYLKALAIDPSNANAHGNYGAVLPLEQALAQVRTAARLDPDSSGIQNNLAIVSMDLHDWPQVVAAAHALINLTPHFIDSAFELAFAEMKLRHGDEAVKAFDLVKPDTPLDKQLVAAGRETFRTLLQPAARKQTISVLDRLRPVATDPQSQSDLLELYLVLDDKHAAMQMLLSGMCPSDPAGCNDLAINPMYAPLHGDPRFGKLAKQYTTITVGTATTAATSSTPATLH